MIKDDFMYKLPQKKTFSIIKRWEYYTGLTAEKL